MASVIFSIPVQRANDALAPFDLQVVMGGHTNERIRISYELWRAHPTPILITGDHDYIYKGLKQLGIPQEQLIQEHDAQSTWDNAALSVPILRRRGASSVVLVTSGFHSSRAYACFAKLAPEISFRTCSTPVQPRGRWELFRLQTMERVKKLSYAWLYQINPWKEGPCK